MTFETLEPIGAEPDPPEPSALSRWWRPEENDPDYEDWCAGEDPMNFETLEPIGEPIAQPVEEKPSPDSAAEVLRRLEDSWGTTPDAPIATGLRGLDAVLGGGLRRGELVALAGSAGTGKSSLAIQVAIEAARAGALALYATVEMPREEVVARAVAREMFLGADASGRDWAVSFGDVLFGKHVAQSTFTSETAWAAATGRYLSARDALLRDVFPRLVVHQLAPGATVASVRDALHRARADARYEGLAVLVVDPLQRLFATAAGERTGKVLASVNALETERVGAVAQDLKVLCDDPRENCAAVFTSDTTKAAVMGDAQGDGLELRGSYQLAHWATIIATFRAHEDPEALAGRVSKLGDADLDADRIRASAPSAMMERDDAVRLGRRYAAVHIAKARRGPPRSFACGFIPGAGLLVEADPEALGDDAPKAKTKPAKTKPARAKAPSISVMLSPMDSKRLTDAVIARQPVEEGDDGDAR